MQVVGRLARLNVGVLLAALIALIVAPPWVPSLLLTVMMLSLIYAILAMSLDILMGYTGLESLGQAAFFGAGAYTVGILTAREGLAWPLAVILALVCGTAIAALTGSMVVRLGGLFFLVITLAFAQVLWGISNRWGEITGGYQGLRGISRPFSWLDSDTHYYYLVLGVFVIAAFLMYRLVKSPFGLTLQGIRDSESRMKTTGFNVWLHKYLVFLICGFFATLSGVLYTFATQFIAPVVLSITTSFEAMLMVIIGGAGTLFGPAIGAGGLIALQNYLSSYFDHWIIVLGGIYIVAVLFAPKGVIGIARAGRRRFEVPPDEAATEDVGLVQPGAASVFRGARWAGSSNPSPRLRSATGEDASHDRVEAVDGAAAIQVSGLSKTFGNIQALEDVSFAASPGSRMAVIGPNGAGKTTLFNLISGLHKPTSGEISLFGHNVTRAQPHARVRMGLGRTFQVTNLYPTLSVLDNIRLGLLGTNPSRYTMYSPVARHDTLNERGTELLGAIGLWEMRDRQVQHLSYGHQRQLEIVMALASEPRVLLLDEPAAGLSVAETKPMVELIRALDPALTILIIEHDMDVAFEVANEITVLHNGQVLAQGTPDEIKANSAVRDVYLGHAHE